MVHALLRWMSLVLLSVGAAAQASAPTPPSIISPSLPGGSVASDAVREALTPVPVAAPAPTSRVAAQDMAAQARAAAVTSAARPATPPAQPARAQPARAQPATAQPARARAETLAVSPIRGRTAIARATAYNSLAGQTDSTPFITATGTRTRPGVVALSRDMLRMFPYGSRIMIEDLSGRNNNLLSGRVFVVEDTMAARKTGSLDIWMASRSDALRFGARQIRITAVR